MCRRARHLSSASEAAKHTACDGLSPAAARVRGEWQQYSVGSKAGGDECHLAAWNADAHSWARENTSGCIGISTVFYKHVGGGGVRVGRVQWRRQAEAWARVPVLQMVHGEGAGARDDVAVLHDAV